MPSSSVQRIANPLYCDRTDDTPLRDNFVLLQSQMLLAQVAILRHEYAVAASVGESRPKIEVFQSLYSPMKYARFLSRSTWAKALSKLPQCVDRAAYSIAIDALRSEIQEELRQVSPGQNYPSNVVDALISIAGFLARGLDPAAYFKKKYSRKLQQEESLDITKLEIGDPDDRTSSGPDLAIVGRWKGSPEMRKKLIEAGEDPEEYLRRNNLILAAPNCGTARFVADALERANQLLRWSYEEQHPLEYVHAVWLNQHITVFHHPDTDGEAARSYLDLLKVLKIQQQHRAFFEFDTAKRSRWIHKWRTVLNLTDRVNFKPMKAPDASAAKSWIGIEPQFDPAGRGRNGGGAYGFRFLLVMAYIVFGPAARSG
jgi:hypothetical protein